MEIKIKRGQKWICNDGDHYVLVKEIFPEIKYALVYHDREKESKYGAGAANDSYGDNITGFTEALNKEYKLAEVSKHNRRKLKL